MLKDIEENFGKRLREERIRLNLSQEELANEIDMKPLSVLQYEKGKTVPNLRTLYALQTIGMNLRYLVFGEILSNSPYDFSEDILHKVGSAVEQLDILFATSGGLSPLVKTRLTLFLLNQVTEQSNDENVNATQLINPDLLDILTQKMIFK